MIIALRLWFDIAFAYLLQRPRQTIVSVIGVAMGVAFFIGISSMMKGMQMYFIDKVVDVSPHVLMSDEFRVPKKQAAESAFKNADLLEIHGLKPRDERRGIRNYQKILQVLAADSSVIASPSLKGQVFLRYGSKNLSANFVGVNPDLQMRVSTLEKDMIKGSLRDLLTNSDGIILGEGLAKKLGIEVGKRLMVISPLGVVMDMKIVGLFSTGITNIDNFEAYGLLKKSQILQGMDNSINSITIRMSDVERAESLARDLETRFLYRSESWKESNKNVFGIFVIQNGVMYSTVGAILIVAGFGIFNIISTVVNEKKRDIAILKSMGFARRDIEIIFFLQGIIVGFIGMLAGWILGYAMVSFLASLRFELEGFVRSEGFLLYRSWIQYAVGGGLSIIAAAFAAWIPARKAAQLQPVDILRGAV